MLLTKIDIAENYDVYIKTYGITYLESAFHYHVKKPTKIQGWILHVSIIISQTEILFSRIIPFILESGVPFKLIKTRACHASINIGEYGISQIGKILTLYPEDDAQIVDLANFIAKNTRDLAGPTILTDLHISSVLYMRYGSFNPILKTDIFGTEYRYIYSPNGELMQDNYSIPHQSDPAVPNPILDLSQALLHYSPKKMLNGNFLITKILKSDPKGNVYKAIHFTGILFKSFVIKEGIQNMVADPFRRDMKNRITWQYELHKCLQNEIPIPKVYDCFEENGNTYLVLENINRITDLGLYCFDKMGNKPWFLLSTPDQLAILNVIKQVIKILTSMHAKGYVHRDVTVTNFIVTLKSKVYAIDLELAYSFYDKYPEPAYGVGTIGFMSPAQIEKQTPTINDDIYSIGALILSLLTGIAPSYLVEEDRNHFSNKIDFLIGYKPLQDVIISCLYENDLYRPPLLKIINEIEDYEKFLVTEKQSRLRKTYTSQDSLLSVIKEGISCLQSDLMTVNKIWFAPYIGSSMENSILGEREISADAYHGISGVLYLISQLRNINQGQWIDREIETKNWAYILNSRTKEFEIVPGLYCGAAGVALSLAKAIEAGSLEKNHTVIQQIRTWLQIGTPLFNLMYGLAGIGMATLQCRNLLDEAFVNDTLRNIYGHLIKAQNRDGSWLIFGNTTSKPEKVNGFGNGIAGIAYFLLEYGSQFKNEQALKSASKALHYLMKVSIPKRGHRAWYNSDKNKVISGWWCHGGMGIALSFLKAFSILNDPQYVSFAELALNMHDKNFVNYNLGQCHGLSGLGEIYLQAFATTKNAQWQERADWIARVLMVQKMRDGESNIFWLTEHFKYPTAGFMTGNSGILHFLLRYSSPEKIGLPFIG
ncbi:MAG TPA: lanthionine synthetase LanC family protein [Puia sp.]|nr:lanthionine synthetase LanC family protein [Puia sp.]